MRIERRIKSLFIDGPCGSLEALFELPPRADDSGTHSGAQSSADAGTDARADPSVVTHAAIVCHPHPGHGGTMHNTVVYRTARALRRAGLATLRFNFRGVEESDGVHDGDGGEVQDAAAAVDWLERKLPGSELWAAGFSFGARTVIRLARRDRRLRRLVCVALPTRAYSIPGLADVSLPSFFVFAADDEFGNRTHFQSTLVRIPEHFETAEIPATDHFFRHKTPELEAAVHDYARRALA